MLRSSSLADSLDAFENHGHSLATTNTRASNGVFAAATREFIREVRCDARAACAKRMTQRNGAAVDVRLFAIEAELFFDCQILRSERFVDLDQIHVGK